MASMTITYPVGVACSAIMYFIIKQNGNFLKKVSDYDVVFAAETVVYE